MATNFSSTTLNIVNAPLYFGMIHSLKAASANRSELVFLPYKNLLAAGLACGGKARQPVWGRQTASLGVQNSLFCGRKRASPQRAGIQPTAQGRRGGNLDLQMRQGRAGDNKSKNGCAFKIFS